MVTYDAAQHDVAVLHQRREASRELLALATVISNHVFLIFPPKKYRRQLTGEQTVSKSGCSNCVITTQALRMIPGALIVAGWHFWASSFHHCWAVWCIFEVRGPPPFGGRLLNWQASDPCILLGLIVHMQPQPCQDHFKWLARGWNACVLSVRIMAFLPSPHAV